MNSIAAMNAVDQQHGVSIRPTGAPVACHPISPGTHCWKG